MEMSEANVKMWSRLGSRATFGMVALDLGKTEEDLVILTADVSTSAGLDRYRKGYPEKYIDVGIAEQNLIGIAAGLSSEGFKVITTTFAPFQTMRCCEQIKVNCGYMKHPICMVGLASGVVLGTLGYTHCCIEDVSIMRSIPNITVISPADCGETVKAISAALNHNESVYLRLTGAAKNPIVYERDYEFRIGKAIKHGEGKDVAIIASGTMVYESLRASEMLGAQGISTTVLDMHTIKPIDTEAIENACESTRLVVTVEEHSVIGGLGSDVAEHKVTLMESPPMYILGLPDGYGKGGEYRDILQGYGLTANGIAKKIMNKINEIGL